MGWLATTPWQGGRGDGLVKLLASELVGHNWGLRLGDVASGTVLDNKVAALLDKLSRANLINIIIVIITVSTVSLHRWGNNDTLRQVTLGLESHGVSTILNNLHIAIYINITILSLYRAIFKSSF